MSLPRIYIAFHSYGIAPTQFALDLARAMRYSGTIIPAALHEQSCYVDSARNKLTKAFLSQPDATHMLMVDVDISFEPDAILKTFTVMQALQLDAVYGNYCLGNGANSIFGPPENAAQEAGVKVNLEPNKVYNDIATGGTGWLLVTRQLMERMQKECPGPWHWFARDLTTDGSDLRGEDITFGLRMYGMNPRPKVAGITTVLLRHQKNQGYFPQFMAEEAGKAMMPGVCIPNPFETDPRYITIGNAVVDKKPLTPEQIRHVESEKVKYEASLEARKVALDGEHTGDPEQSSGNPGENNRHPVEGPTSGSVSGETGS